ncbi:DUF5134 domain-containing protein [Streptomyces sp. CAU 1734]|uniref:DUF5134 domain-containing protein n=1 Tax=Streptomyces sp. CAU 1734 TaxID=3140360 RepID=UPI00326191E1
MHGPAVSGWLLVALAGTAGVYCLARMRGCSGGARRAAGGEAVMGLGMAVMAVPAGLPGLADQAWPVYAAVFGGLALRALRSARHGAGHHLHHLIGSLAMVYMALAMASGGGHGARTAGGVPLVTGALIAYYAVYLLRGGVGLVAAPAGPAARTAPGGAADTGLVPACRLAMGTGMMAMLVAL